MTSKFKHVITYVGTVSNLQVLTQVLSAAWCSLLLGEATNITALETGYLLSVRNRRDSYSWKMVTNKMLTHSVVSIWESLSSSYRDACWKKSHERRVPLQRALSREPAEAPKDSARLISHTLLYKHNQSHSWWVRNFSLLHRSLQGDLKSNSKKSFY